jgi:uncharacterized protein YndB with AHSA1/START domain
MFSRIGNHLRFRVNRLFMMMLIGLSILSVRVDADSNFEELVPGSIPIKWPRHFSPKTAQVFVHNEVTVHTSAPTVWHYLITTELWPSWIDASNIRVLNTDHVLRQRAKFTWTTMGGQSYESTVAECIPNERLTWFTEGMVSARAYHVWLVVPVADGCKVVSYKAINKWDATGETPAYSVEHGTIQIWLNRLKAVAEAATKTGDLPSQGAQGHFKKSGT